MHKRSSSADMEEISVLFHASSIGRCDVVQNAVGALRSSGASQEELFSLISSGRPEDDATPLHLAAVSGHSDVIRYLLVSWGCTLEAGFIDKLKKSRITISFRFLSSS